MNTASTSLASSGSEATSLAMALFGSPTASAMVGPETRAMTEPRCTELDLSHSQALSRTGRPKVARKPSTAGIAGRNASRESRNAASAREAIEASASPWWSDARWRFIRPVRTNENASGSSAPPS